MKEEQSDKLELGRMYQIVEDFVGRFDKIIIKKEAQSMQMRNPFTNKPVSVASLIGELVALWIRQTDVVSDVTSELDGMSDSIDSPDFLKRSDLELFLIQTESNRSTTAIELLDAIHVARANDLIDEGFSKQCDELGKENIQLKKKVDELMKQLKKCQDAFEGYKKLVHGAKGGTLLGEVDEIRP